MCGIVGYVGEREAAPVLIQGLNRLEYRGYDSAGIAIQSSGAVSTVRAVGRVAQLSALVLASPLTGRTGIGHTRWATHGEPSVRNAHPHASYDGRIHVVHNGIIDNAPDLRDRLEAMGTAFASDTDTEVLAHLIALSAETSLEEAVKSALVQVVGTYALAVIDKDSPNKIVVARNGSPLVIGVGEGEMFIASDVAALVQHTSQVVHLQDGELASVTPQGFQTFTATAILTSRPPETVEMSVEELELDGHANFMHKEIHEQPTSLLRMISGRLDDRGATARLDGLRLEPRQLREFKRVKILGCGSSYYVGQMGAHMIESMARMPADAEAASEFRYRNPIIEPDTLYVVVSQSGETADTLFAAREVRAKGGYSVGLVNSVGSSIAREMDGGIYLHAGPELAVASTKALTHQATGLALLAVALGRVRDLSFADGLRLINAIRALPDQIAEILADEARIAEVGKYLSSYKNLFFIGRVAGYPVAREGAQKFKEITYAHAEAYQASELKHGPLALICPTCHTVALVSDDDLFDRNATAIHEIQARHGEVTVITHDAVADRFNSEVAVLTVPKSEPELDPILMMIPTQLLAYHAALALGEDIDRPRNLAKSVTVE